MFYGVKKQINVLFRDCTSRQNVKISTETTPLRIGREKS